MKTLLNKTVKTRAGLFVTLTLMVMLSVFISIPAFAGNGDGSGGGQGNPLSLATSYPANGQQGVATATDIKLTFSKNVINMSVKDNNSNCFSMTTASGESVPIQVIMADDQMEPEEKRDVILKPQSELKPGITYKITIAGGLQSKSGVTLGSPVHVSFTTVAPPKATNIVSTGEGTTQPTQQPASKTEASQTATSESKGAKDSSKTEDKPATQTEPAKTAQEGLDSETTNKDVTPQAQEKEKEEVGAVGETSAVEASSANQDQKNNSGSTSIILIIGLAIAVAAGYFWLKNKRK